MARSRRCDDLYVVLAVTLLASCCHAETYRNPEYGFSVDIRAGMPTCRSEPPGHDHGLMMFLDTGPGGCDRPELRPYISVTGDYNVLDQLSPEAALEGILAGLEDVRLGGAPQDLGIDGRHSATSKSESGDGWIKIWVVTQRGTRPKTGDEIPRVNYFATLHTRPERFDGDVSLFRVVLKGIEIYPPE